MNRNGETYWLSKPSYTYLDPNQSISLNISFASSLNVSEKDENQYFNYSTTKLRFTLIDNRTAGNPRINIDLEYNHLTSLLCDLHELSSNNYKNAFMQSSQLNISRVYSKNKKDLTFRFILMENKPVLELIITDPIANMNQCRILMNGKSFKNMVRFLKNTRDDFSNIDTNISNILFNQYHSKSLLGSINGRLFNIETLLSRFSSVMSSKIDSIKSQPVTTNMKMSDEKTDEIIKSTDANHVFEGPFNDDVESNDDDYNGVDYTQKFTDISQASNMFNNVNLDGENELEKIERKHNNDMENRSSIPFIYKIFDGELMNFNSWVMSFTSTIESSDTITFSPLDVIFDISNNAQIFKTFDDKNSYYFSQYIMTYLIKTKIKEFIEHNGQIDIRIPIIRFDNIVYSKESYLYNLCIELTSTFLLYSLFIRRLDALNNVPNKNNYKIINTAIKILFSPFIFSLDYENESKLILENVFDQFKNFNKNGIVKLFEDKYSSMTGGNLNITEDLYYGYSKSFITNVINMIKTGYSINKNDLIRLASDYDIPYSDFSKIKDIESVKSNIVNNLINKYDEVSNIDEDDDVPFDARNDLNQTINTSDKDDKLTLFLECIENINDGDLYNQFKTFNTFNEVVNDFMNHDIPPEVFKIRRAIEMNNNLSTKLEVFKFAKLIKEDSNITEVSDGNDNYNDFDGVDPTSVIDNIM